MFLSLPQNQLMRYLMLLCLSLFFTKTDAQSDSFINFITYNIRYDNPKDGPNAWSERKEAIIDQIQQYRPDFLGIQEGLQHQVNFLDENLPHHFYIGVGRSQGHSNDKGEYAAIFYNYEKYNSLLAGTFWLSPSPNEYSVGWDAALPRICTYGLFEEKAGGQKFWVFNTHFDHKGEQARLESAKLISDQILQLNTEGYPVILMGDFNAEPGSEPINILQKKMEDTFASHPEVAFGPNGTFNNFDPNHPLDRRIDYIFSKGFKVQTVWHIDDRRKDNYFYSDHLPILLVSKIHK